MGTRILSLSKVLIQDFHNNYIKIKYGDKAEKLPTHADSFTYKIEAQNVYEGVI